MQVPADILTNPDAFRMFQENQSALSGALSRLLVVVERYPEIQSTIAFRDLMTQLEGTENRIAVERRRFNQVARNYNTRLLRFPTNVVVGLFGWEFEKRPYFEATEGAEQAPQVDFSDD
jgi:LemA protein